MHFGIRVTSRAKAAHAYIKRFLGDKRSRGDLYLTWLQIEAAVINQIAAVSSRTTILRDRIPIDIDKKLYHGCFGVVTWHALRLAQQHIKFLSLPMQLCTGNFKRSMGLPCAHVCDLSHAGSFLGATYTGKLIIRLEIIEFEGAECYNELGISKALRQ